MSSDVLLTSEVAQLLRVSEATVRLWERAGRLHATKTTGGVRLFDRHDVERLVRERAQAVDTPPDASRNQ